ncbi:sex comb on midleg-like protein 4 isoform X2 [Phyllopteryx taeniolatus]|uniref:sex comb on midleg-like protein 4 isoform X2 n=1 Tax=Phyllopteryx taeniolatus TaxID=161469 RepID=UPI002AD3AD99|nr:sex comb on midleg-like protein 4 isoform X2 [Phyllopteryx taeniolatus]
MHLDSRQPRSLFVVRVPPLLLLLLRPDTRRPTGRPGVMSGPSGALQMQALGPRFRAVGPPGKVPGRKRGRPPTRKLHFQSSYYTEPVCVAPSVPKKRGRKPGFKLKSRMVTSPLATSPPRCTPEPELGSLPQDAAIVPCSASPHALTETSVPDDFVFEPSTDSKRYNSVFGVMTSQYNRKHGYGYRGNSSGCPTPRMATCRPDTSSGSFPEANKNVSSAVAMEPGECRRPPGKDPSSWGVDEVVCFIKDADPQALGPHAETFRKHEIDGDALLLLKSEMMMKYLGLKLGPALKLCYHIDRLKQNRL